VTNLARGVTVGTGGTLRMGEASTAGMGVQHGG